MKPANPPAFPHRDPELTFDRPGMTLHDYFAGQALANAAICTGVAPDYQLAAWFGKHANHIMRYQIVAKQAGEYADAMLAARQGSSNAD